MPKHRAHLAYAMTSKQCWDLPNSSISFSHPFPTPAKRLARCQPPKIWLGADGREKALPSAAASPPSRRHAPVRMDWSTRRVVDRISMIRMSAGTLSPTTRARAEQRGQAAPAAPAAPGKGDGKPQPCHPSRALPQGLGLPVCTSVPAVCPRSLFQLPALQGRDWFLRRITTSLWWCGRQGSTQPAATRGPACGKPGSCPGMPPFCV